MNSKFNMLNTEMVSLRHLANQIKDKEVKTQCQSRHADDEQFPDFGGNHLSQIESNRNQQPAQLGESNEIVISSVHATNQYSSIQTSNKKPVAEQPLAKNYLAPLLASPSLIDTSSFPIAEAKTEQPMIEHTYTLGEGST